MKNPNFSSHLTTFVVLSLIILSSSLAISEVVDEDLQGIEYIDITHKITPELPSWDSKTGTGEFIWLVSSIKHGNLSNNSEFKLSTHTGTHIDAPSHFFQEYYDQGIDITSLDLATLHGRVLVVDVPRNKNITADVLRKLWIPWTVQRVLFKTLNTERKLMHKKEFDTSFTGFTADGAEWMVNYTNVKLVGVDYLSTSIYTQPAEVHRTFLKNQHIFSQQPQFLVAVATAERFPEYTFSMHADIFTRMVLVEGLNLDDVAPGYYDLQCLPLRMARADGCPARCILMRTRHWSK